MFSLQLSESDVIDALEQVLNAKTSKVVTKDYALNALVKLSCRIPAQTEVSSMSF